MRVSEKEEDIFVVGMSHIGTVRPDEGVNELGGRIWYLYFWGRREGVFAEMAQRGVNSVCMRFRLHFSREGA